MQAVKRQRRCAQRKAAHEQAEEESQTDDDCVSLITCHGDGKDLMDCDEDMTAAALSPVTDKAGAPPNANLSAVRDEMSATALPPPMTDKADAPPNADLSAVRDEASATALPPVTDKADAPPNADQPTIRGKAAKTEPSSNSKSLPVKPDAAAEHDKAAGSDRLAFQDYLDH